MEIFLAILFLAVGFVLIIKGGDLFVDSSIWLAKRTGIPEIIIGATIVSIGTTIPEICVSTISVIKGLKDPLLATSFNEIAIGNSVGSMLCNTALILAIVMMIRPPKTEGKSFIEKAVALILILIILIIFVMTGGALSPLEGVALLILFLGFMYMNYKDAKREMLVEKNACQMEEEKKLAKEKNTVKMVTLFFVGAAAIGVGAFLLSTYGEKLARMMGVPAQIIGVTIIAIGTSLPEFVTSITALRKGNCQIGLGNIIGANIINATLLLGIATVISGKGLPVDDVTKNVALWVLLAITLTLCIPAIIKGKTMKWQGYALLAMYLGFITYNIILVV